MSICVDISTGIDMGHFCMLDVSQYLINGL